MNIDKTLFAQLMEFVPWTSFARIVARYSGDARVCALPNTQHPTLPHHGLRAVDLARILE